MIGAWDTNADITELQEAQQNLLSGEQERVAKLSKTNTALKNSLDRLAVDSELDTFLGHVILEIKHQLGAQRSHLFLYNPPSHTLNLQGSETDEVLPKERLQDIEPFLSLLCHFRQRKNRNQGELAI
ncbi:hypothetical protein [Calothrix sp. NIES-2098]|uniref:hypothetical protein n=1 Tax=Calothrix sp. NIES-2098 TaxID=1954171 RepID=UPI000B5DEB08|nr:GAF domain-containing protein [Calothrix sp. NIES-2098]